jgi:hypothetical protein
VLSFGWVILHDLVTYLTHITEDRNTVSYNNAPFMFDEGQTSLLWDTNKGHVSISCKISRK